MRDKQDRDVYPFCHLRFSKGCQIKRSLFLFLLPHLHITQMENKQARRENSDVSVTR